jgi:hypothetical protein
MIYCRIRKSKANLDPVTGAKKKGFLDPQIPAHKNDEPARDDPQ